MDSGDEEQTDLLPWYSQLRTYVDGLVGERPLSVSNGPNEAVGALSPEAEDLGYAVRTGIGETRSVDSLAGRLPGTRT